MEDEKWQQVKELFGEAGALPAHEREAYLERECAGDEALLERVRSLLKAHEQADQFLREPTVGADVDATSDSISAEPGMSIGPYRLLERIGEGGFGVVYMAEQRTPIARRVALKIIKPGMDTKQVIARFDAERQALAMMDHPNIARVFDAGETPSSGGGRPFFVMELVKGVPITRYCDENALSIAKRLELFTTACEAVQHAHQKGIIHRDIKPSNVLVMMRDGLPIVKVIDFGIAKATTSGAGGRGPRLTDKTLFTEFHQLIGTPQYMSPEQASSELDIDTRSDIYSLGVLLYELLTGTTPFDPERLRSAALGEIQRIIREEEPQKPSTRLSTLATLPSVATHRRTDSATLSRSLRGELDWIVMKTLEKDRTRRYATATDLAADVQRYLRHEPVTAGPPSRAYRVRKFVRRNRPAVAAASLVAIALILGIIGTSAMLAWALREAERAHRAETAERERADELEKVADFQASQLSDIDPSIMGIRLRRNILDKRRAFMESREANEDEIEASLRELDQHLAGVNFTNVALDALDENIFERALKAIDEQFAGQPLLRARLLQTVADTLRLLGVLNRAEWPQLEALEIRERILGDEHFDTLESMNNLGVLLMVSGRHDEALSLFRKATEGRRAAFGDEDLYTLTSISNVGDLLLQQGKLQEVDPYYREALEIGRRVYGEEHPRTLHSVHRMAVLLRHLGRYEEADRLFEGVIAARRRVLGPSHRDTLDSLNSRGVLLWNWGKVQEAEASFREYLESVEALFGEEHPSTLTALNNLGMALLTKQKFEEGEYVARDVLARSTRLLGESHPDTLLALGNLGSVLARQGRFADAEPYARATLERSRRVLGDDHADIPILLNNLAEVRRELGHLEDAERLGAEAVKAGARLIGPSHGLTASFRAEHARTLAAMKRFVEAEREALQAHNVFESAFGPGHFRTRRVVHQIADLYDAWEGAEPDNGYGERAKEWRERLPQTE